VAFFVYANKSIDELISASEYRYSKHQKKELQETQTNTIHHEHQSLRYKNKIKEKGHNMLNTITEPSSHQDVRRSRKNIEEDNRYRTENIWEKTTSRKCVNQSTMLFS